MARKLSMRAGLLVLIVGAAAVAGAYLSDCAGLSPGVGLGPPSTPNRPDPTPPQPDAPAEVTRTVTVDGSLCALGDGKPAPCDDVCASLSDDEGPVVIDGAAGSHKVVEDLRQCLQDAGLAVRLVSG